MNAANKTREIRSSTSEVEAVLGGYATTKPAVNPTLTRPEGWKALAMVALIVRGNQLLSQLTDATLEMIISGDVDGAAVYREIFSTPVIAPAATEAPAPELYGFEHVIERGRPKDTGERTVHGHRVITRPGFNDRCVEYPFNSGSLVDESIYERVYDDRAARHVLPLLEALSAWLEFGRAAGLDSNNPLFDQSTELVKKAKGL